MRMPCVRAVERIGLTIARNLLIVLPPIDLLPMGCMYDNQVIKVTLSVNWLPLRTSKNYQNPSLRSKEIRLDDVT